MRLPHQSIRVLTSLLLLTWIEAVTLKKEYRCPLGFQLAFTTSGSPICYRQKDPETFADKFKDCTGNLYSSKLYHSLNFTKNKHVLWTEYKSLYPGGPFIDWSYTDTSGDILLSTYDVKYDSSLGIDEELCVVIDPVSNFTAARCDERHYRYCFVNPYSDEDNRETKECTSGSWRFFSPYSTCLTPMTGVAGGAVRATWRQAQELCQRRGAALLNRGWRYSNSPRLHTSGALPYYPMGVIKDPTSDELSYVIGNERTLIPPDEWNFDDSTEVSSDAVFGAIRNDFWRLVNSSFVFLDVVCEHPVPLRDISLNLVLNWENNILLRADNIIKKSDIQCFTDSLIYYPSKVSLSGLNEQVESTFRLKPDLNGYYWCIQRDQKNYHVSQSNKILYIRSKESVQNVYACKIRLRKEYRFQNMEKMNKLWQKKLEEYIYYRTKYVAIFGEPPANDTETVLKRFKMERPELDWKDTDVIYGLRLRRLYLDARTALVHVTLSPEMTPPTPGTWDTLEVIFMKPAYFCPGFDSVPSKGLGEHATTVGCRTFTCVGDFNEGVQWVETATEGCTLGPAVARTAVNIGFDDSVMPTLLPIPPRQSEKSPIEDPLPGGDDSSSSDESKKPGPTRPPSTTESTTETEWTITTENNKEPCTEPATTESTSTETPTTEAVPTTTAAPIPIEEQLQQVVEELEQLVVGNDVVSIDSISHPFDQVNEILDVEDSELEIPGELLHLLDKLASRVELSAGQQVMEVRNNVAILMADATPENPVRGVRVAARDYDVFSNTSFGFIDGSLDSGQLLRNVSEAVVYLPASVSSSSRRVSFVAFRNQRAFSSPLRVNSRVFSVNVENITQFENGEVIDIHLSPIVEDPERNQSRACAYWHFTTNGSGYWSQEGCTLIRATVEGAMDTCRCTHLTHFAEVLIPRTVFSEQNENALEILSIIGCVMSVFGLAMIALTACLFRSWRRDYSNKIWLQLCISIFILVVSFLVVIFANFSQYNVACMLVGVALHYSVLSSFCWMLVAAVLSYRRLVLVFTRDMSHKLLRASAFSWGTPCAVVGILLAVNPQSYQGQFDDMSPSGAFCYPSGLSLWLAVYAPIAAMLLANWILFILIVRSVFASRRIQRHGDSNEALRCASVSCLLVFLFGLPWIFGLFAYNVVAAYLFTLTVTFQGFVLFIFFVLGNKKTRDLWLNKLKIKQTRKVPVTSSTYTNRSTGPGWRGGAEGATSIEAKTSKPRSLTSPDDSRFS